MSGSCWYGNESSVYFSWSKVHFLNRESEIFFNFDWLDNSYWYTENRACLYFGFIKTLYFGVINLVSFSKV